MARLPGLMGSVSLAICLLFLLAALLGVGVGFRWGQVEAWRWDFFRGVQSFGPAFSTVPMRWPFSEKTSSTSGLSVW